MTRYHLLALSAAMIAAATTLPAQEVLRASPSSRGTTQVTLSYPQPAGTMAAMPGMTAAPATAARPAGSPAVPSAPPLVIRIDYGQPHLRGRTLHADGLVPYGKPWRTGANGSTTLTTDVDLVIGGTAIAKGTYVLYTIPGEAGWKLILQRSVGQTPMQYSDTNDVARIDLRYLRLAMPIETLTMWLIPSTEPGPARGELRFAWGTDQLSTDWSIR